MINRLLKIFIVLFLLLSFDDLEAQDKRSQLPFLLQNAYTEVNVGVINYNFGADQFSNIPGFVFKGIDRETGPAVRLVLYGYEFNKYLSAQISYMRPVLWVQYNYFHDLTPITSSVWMNVGGLTLKPQLPINRYFSIYGEAGLALVTRHGFDSPDGQSIVKNATYAGFLLGTGFKYHMNNHWAWQLSTTYSPTNKSVSQPATTFVSAGFTYKYLKLTPEKLDKAAQTGYIHPANLLQIGYSNNVTGYGINNALKKACLFWGGDAEVKSGFTIDYQCNIFHSAKHFSLNVGVSMGFWKTRVKGEDFQTFSLYPVFRYDFLHTKPVDAYFYYSVAGPTYISKFILDDQKTGEHFTFQDTMGAGVFFGVNRNYNAELKIGHYSNGNIFPENDAVKVPLSLNIGYAF